MPSDRQSEANRENAKRSTGPRTEAGKARSRRNAVKHGLTGKTVAEQLGESAEDYEELRQSLFDDFQPQTALGREIIDELTSVTWNLRRVPQLENAVFDTSMVKTLIDAAGIMSKVVEHDRERLAKLQEQMIASASGNTPTTLQCGATRLVFGSEPILPLERYRTSHLRQRQRLLDQFEQVGRRKSRRDQNVDRG